MEPEQQPMQSSTDLFGPARLIRIGHRTGDGFVQRQAKSITAGVLIFIIIAAIVFLFDQTRTTFIHIVDAFAITACLIVLWLLHRTGSLVVVFSAIATVSRKLGGFVWVSKEWLLLVEQQRMNTSRLDRE